MNLLDILFSKRKQEKEELKNLEPEIKNLEITLGLYGRTNTEVYYDPLYERNRGRIYDLKGRKEYLEDLKKRLRNKYKSPNVIKARGIFSPNSSENTGLIFNPIIRNLSEINEIVYVVLIRKTINIPKTLKIENSTKYKIKSTNSECDNIENYYIIKELNEDTKKFIKDLKKDNIKTAVGSNLTKEYNYKNDTININNIHRKNPYTILHEVGHRVSDNREQLRGGKYYGNYRSLDKKVNTSHNLHNSIMNNVGNLSTLMNEANASYHAAALAKKYNLPREMQKAGNKSLDYSFRTYESNAANKMMTDDTVRLLGKYKNK